MSDVSKSNRRICDEIASTLTEQINSGELADGSLLPSERELVEMFGASRNAVREALHTLQAQGLIAVRPKARARVTQLNDGTFFKQLSGVALALLARPNGAADFEEARTLFECGLARYAARYASPKVIEALLVALIENKKAIGTPKLFVDTDKAFHDILVGIPHNPIFTALNRALGEWMQALRAVPSQASIKGAIQSAYDGHHDIYNAIAAHDVEAADRAMANHLKTGSEFYRKAMLGKAK